MPPINIADVKIEHSVNQFRRLFSSKKNFCVDIIMKGIILVPEGKWIVYYSLQKLEQCHSTGTIILDMKWIKYIVMTF